MTIFDAIINNNLSEVMKYIGSGTYTALDVEPDSFEGKDGMTSFRRNPKNALEVAKSLNRKEIVEYLESSLTPQTEE